MLFFKPCYVTKEKPNSHKRQPLSLNLEYDQKKFVSNTTLYCSKEYLNMTLQTPGGGSSND